MSFRTRTRHLENTVSEALEREAQYRRAIEAAEERARRATDLRGGLLAIHQPHAQMKQDVGPPALYCTACQLEWPCETVEYIFQFGRHAVPAEPAD